MSILLNYESAFVVIVLGGRDSCGKCGDVCCGIYSGCGGRRGGIANVVWWGRKKERKGKMARNKENKNRQSEKKERSMRQNREKERKTNQKICRKKEE